MVELAKGKIWKLNDILKMEVHFVHFFLAHKIEKQKLKASLRKGENVTEL